MGPGAAQRRQDSIIEIDVECGQESVEFFAHTSVLALSAHFFGDRHAPGSFGLTHLGLDHFLAA
jgi:hypothetical protein